MRSSKNKNPCFDCLASEKENEEVCKTIRAMLNKSNSVQVGMKDPGSIGTLTIGEAEPLYHRPDMGCRCLCGRSHAGGRGGVCLIRMCINVYSH